MSGLVFACVAPHGLPLIPNLSEDAEGAGATRAAMEELGRRCAAAHPDVIVVATPHGTRVEGRICLAGAARAAGTLRWDGRQIEMNVPVDAVLTRAIHDTAEAHGVPVALASFGGNRADQSSIVLDWGAIVPLSFLGHGRDAAGHGDQLAGPPASDTGPSVVIAAPSRLLPRESLLAFGRAVAEAVAQAGQRVAFVASCDWGHTHAENGPYGFHPAAAEVDQIVVRALRDGDPGRLLALPEELVRDAAIDGLWQTLMLAGVLEHTSMRGEVLSYEAPTYYGMCVAHWQP